MQIRLLAIGNKLPNWVNTGFREYAKRLPPECALTLKEIPAQKRGKNADLARIKQQEGNALLASCHDRNLVVALEVKGKAHSTESLSLLLKSWKEGRRNVDLLVGGPEGLSDACLKRAEACWSLSPLTLPHPLVRIIVAEQLFRAYSILINHPYHR